MRRRSKKLGDPMRRGIDGDREPLVLDDALDDDDELRLLYRLPDRLLYELLPELRDEWLVADLERDREREVLDLVVWLVLRLLDLLVSDFAVSTVGLRFLGGDGTLGGFISFFSGLLFVGTSRSKISGTTFFSLPSLILNGLMAIFGLSTVATGRLLSSISAVGCFLSFCTSATMSFCTSIGLVNEGGSVVFFFSSDSFALAVSCALSLSNSFSLAVIGSSWKSLSPVSSSESMDLSSEGWSFTTGRIAGFLLLLGDLLRGLEERLRLFSKISRYFSGFRSAGE